MLSNRQRSFRIIAAMTVYPLIVFLLSAGVVTAAEGDKSPSKGTRSQAAKKAAPKADVSRRSGAKPVTKPQDCTGDFPKIQKVQPDEGAAGTKVTISGKHFGVPGCLSMVSFGPGSPAKFVHKDDTTITTTVPIAKKGLRLLTVNTAAGQDSKPFLVR